MAGYETPESESLEFADYAIIHEVYEGENAHEAFENELESALAAKCSTIIIEPTKLSEETARWISIGNCLHKTAVLSGFGSLVCGVVWPDRLYICLPMGSISFFCTGLYALSWQFDPCCKYQVETNPRNLAKLPLNRLTAASSVVLVRKDDTRRKILHTTLTLLAVALCTWRLYKSFSH